MPHLLDEDPDDARESREELRRDNRSLPCDECNGSGFVFDAVDGRSRCPVCRAPLLAAPRAALERLELTLRQAHAALTDEERLALTAECVRIRRALGMTPKLVAVAGRFPPLRLA